MTALNGAALRPRALFPLSSWQSLTVTPNRRRSPPPTVRVAQADPVAVTSAEGAPAVLNQHCS